MFTLVFNDPKKLGEKHISWFVKNESYNSMSLYEVIEVSYDHPGAIVIPRVETRLVETVKRTSIEASTWVLLEAAEKAVDQSIRKQK